MASAILAGPAFGDSIDDYIREQMARNQIPGVAVAVVRSGTVEKLAGYGTANLEWDTPVGHDTAFQLASATKPLTGTGLMLLVEEGKLDLDAPVGRYLEDAPEAWNAITVRHLASHTSGINDDVGPAQTAADAYEVMKQLPLAFPAGERSTYGISGFIALMVLVERLTGEPFDAFMARRLFEPLAMASTRFDHATERDGIRFADLVPHRAMRL